MVGKTQDIIKYVVYVSLGDFHCYLENNNQYLNKDINDPNVELFDTKEEATIIADDNSNDHGGLLHYKVKSIQTIK
jgi:hypothetical protein